MLPEQFFQCAAVRRLSCCQFIKHNAETVNIALRTDLIPLAGDHFGSGIQRCSHDTAAAAAACDLCQTEIGDLDMLIFSGKENVIRLYIAVDDTVGIPGVRHCFGNLDHQWKQFLQRQFFTLEAHGFQRTPLHQFHGEKVFSIRRLSRINGLNDPGVIQSCRQTCFFEKFTDKIRIVGKFRFQQFECSITADTELSRMVNDADVAGADQMIEAETGNDFAGTVLRRTHFSLLRAALKKSRISSPDFSASTPPVTCTCQSIPEKPVISNAEPQQPLRGSGNP